MSTKAFSLGILIATCAIAHAQAPLDLTIIHTNDLHAHVEPTTIQGKTYGGYARLATLIKKLRAGSEPSLLLNGGDCFQGTIFYNTYAGMSECAFMNAVGYDASCLGNHEFDNGPAQLAPFVKLATFPFVCANMDFSGEPKLDGLIRPSTTLTVNGQRIGIVGAVTPDVMNISSPGPNLKLIDLTKSVQQQIDSLEKGGVNKIILVTHIGYREDQVLVAKLHGVDLVVGGHSHTPLGTPPIPGWLPSQGPYPTYTVAADGHKVPIVQSYEWGKALGHLRVHFDSAGNLTKVSDAAPIVVDETVPEDKSILSMIAAFKKPIEAQMNRVVGQSTVDISSKELVGEIIADATFEAAAAFHPDFAVQNLGGVRETLQSGPITYAQALSIQPFGTGLTVVEMTGSQLLEVLTQGVPDSNKLGGKLLPSKELSYEVNFGTGPRISNVLIGGAPIILAKIYRVSVNAFTAGGGDNHTLFASLKDHTTDIKVVDLAALLAYLNQHSPISEIPTQRINTRQ